MRKSAIYERALTAMSLKRWDVAHRELANVLTSSPGEARAFSLMSACSYNLSKFDRALEEASKAIEVDPEWAHAYYVQALCHMSRRMYDQSDAVLACALELDPENPDYLGVKANLCFVRLSWRAGLDILDRALAIDPHHAGCLRLKVYGLRQSGGGKEADELVKHALSLHPQDARLYAEAGWNVMQADAARAVEHFEEALRLNPTEQYFEEGLEQARFQNRWFFKLFKRVMTPPVACIYYLAWFLCSGFIPEKVSHAWVYMPIIYLIVCSALTAVYDYLTGVIKRKRKNL